MGETTDDATCKIRAAACHGQVECESVSLSQRITSLAHDRIQDVAVGNVGAFARSNLQGRRSTPSSTQRGDACDTLS